MKNLTRMSIAALALASLLGMTACTPDQTDKPSGFKDKFTASSSVPAEWQNTAGWSQDKIAPEMASVLAIGDKTGYLEPNAKGAGFHLTVVDGSGKRVFTSKDSSVENVSSAAFAVVDKDGASYWVFAQTDGKADDNPGLKKTSELVIVDKDGKEVASKTLENTFTVNIQSDGILTAPITSDTKLLGLPTKIIDVATGNDSPVPAKEGFRFAGRFDGVDVFAKSNGIEKNGKGTITNGTWTLETTTTGLLDRTQEGTSMYNSKEFVSSSPYSFGKLIQVERSGAGQTDPTTGVVTPLCDLIDVHTGKPGTNAGGGQCVYSPLTSPDGSIVYFENEKDKTSGIISLKTGKTYTIAENDRFLPTVISDNGDVYGVTNSTVYGFNFLNEDAPKKIDGAEVSPVSLSTSGLAAFVVENKKLEFLVKKTEEKK